MVELIGWTVATIVIRSCWVKRGIFNFNWYLTRGKIKRNIYEKYYYFVKYKKWIN